MSTPFKLKNGAQFLSTEAPGGIYNASQLKKLAELCEKGPAFVKATEDQRLAMILPDEQVESTREELRSLGITLRPYMTGVHQPTSCIGELCPDSEQDALTTAMDVSQELDAITSSSPLRIGINGCAKCCVPCHTYDISVMGESSGYRVTLGGKNSHMPELAVFMAEGIPPVELPKILRRVVEAFQSTANAGESLQEVLERCGSEAFVKALAPYSQDAGGSISDNTSPMAPSEPGSSDATLSLTEEPMMDEVQAEAEPAAAEAPMMDEVQADVQPTTAEGPEASAPDLTTEDGLAAAERAVEEKLSIDEEETFAAPTDTAATDASITADASMTADASFGEDAALTAEPEAVQLENTPIAEAPAMELNNEAAIDEAPSMELGEPEIMGSPDASFEGSMDIDPSVNHSQGTGLGVDIDPNAQQHAQSELSSDVIIADADAEVESPDTLGATAISEEQENKFEAELEASIEEEKVVEASNVAEEDDSTERQKTLSMVQGSLEAKTPDPLEPIENVEISEEESQALELSELDLEPEVISQDVELPNNVIPVGDIADSEGTPAEAGEGRWSLAALVPQGDHSIEFQFDSGAKVSFDLTRLSLPASGRTLRVGSQDFLITQQGAGYSVATDGMSVTLPGSTKAAA